MLVQYTNDQLNTFDAYKQLGMEADYRNYRNVRDICTLLNINSEFILLTNNPDKIRCFKELGLKIKDIESIEIEPNPFNLPYLHSKMNYGHLLVQTKKKIQTYSLPHEKIEPFIPYNLKSATRFVHVSSYYLPIKPVNDQILLSFDEFDELKNEIDKADLENFIFCQCNDYMMIKVLDTNMYDIYKFLKTKPYWFKVNVYYDIVSKNDYIVLEYGNCNDENRVPLVRIHSESIFNRFPLTNRKYTNRYKSSVETIVKNGAGLIILLYNDGKGSGLGRFVLDKLSITKTDLGITTDARDYNGALLLLKNHTSLSCVDVLYGDTPRVLEEHFRAHDIGIRRMIPLGSSNNDDKGHNSIHARINNTINYLELCKNVDVNISKFITNTTMYVTGIGSSEGHAKYLCSLKPYCFKFVPLVDIKVCDIRIPCIVFSQGLSPNANICFNHYNYKNLIVITTITKNHKDITRVETLKRLENDSNVIITFPEEVPDNTLIRINGPIGAYYVADKIYNANYKYNHNNNNDDEFFDQINKIQSNMGLYVYTECFRDLVKMICRHNSVTIIFPSNLKDFTTNIRNKFIEGCYINPIMTNNLEFAHGVFQSLEAQIVMNRTKPIVFVIGENDPDINEICKNKCLIYNYPITSNNPLDLKLIEIEMFFNHVVFGVICESNIDQINWFGKKTQHIIYDKQN